MNKLWIPIVLAIILCMYPTRFDTPVGQTDAAHLYGVAEALKENWNYNQKLPDYSSYLISEVDTVKDYPVILTTFFAILSYAIPDMILLNGLFILIFLITGIIYLYKLLKELGCTEKTAFLATIFLALNLRLYYYAIAGVWPFLIASLLAIPSLYYFARALKGKNIIVAIIFTLATILSHTMMGLFLLFLELALAIGYYFEKTKITVWTSTKTITDSTIIKPAIITLASSIILFAITSFMFVLTKGRGDWLMNWISYMLAPYDGFQNAWYYIFVFDGPILAFFGIIGGLYLIYKNQWKIFSLWLASTIIVISPWLVLGPTKLASYTQKFYVFYFIILAITFLICTENMKKTGTALIIASLLFNFFATAAFLSIIEPAITQEQYQKAIDTQQYSEQKILYVYNTPTTNTFAEFKWIPIIAKSKHFWTRNETAELGQDRTIIV